MMRSRCARVTATWNSLRSSSRARVRALEWGTSPGTAPTTMTVGHSRPLAAEGGERDRAVAVEERRAAASACRQPHPEIGTGSVGVLEQQVLDGVRTAAGRVGTQRVFIQPRPQRPPLGRPSDSPSSARTAAPSSPVTRLRNGIAARCNAAATGSSWAFVRARTAIAPQRPPGGRGHGRARPAAASACAREAAGHGEAHHPDGTRSERRRSHP